MYRREYPDVPGLFDARFSEYNQPSLAREFQKTWLVSLIGLLILASGCGILFWNEGRAVRTAAALEEGLRDILVPETTNVVFDENNGALVLVSGELNIPDSLKDEKYGISMPAVKMRRVVQVYQWQETEDTRTGSNLQGEEHDNHEKSYSYSTDWYDYHIDSSNFASTLGHHNPHLDSWPLNSSLLTNSRVKIGGFLLGTDLKQKFNDFKPFTSDFKPLEGDFKIYAGLYYHTANLWQPEVGDWRVQFSYAGRHGEQFSVVGRQSGREIRPYQTSGGENLLLLHSGTRPPAEIFQSEHHSNRTATWLYRLAGWLVSFIGLSCLSSLLEMFLDQNPSVRTLVSLSVTNLHFSVSISLTLFIISLAWLLYRPLLSLLLISVGVLPHIIPLIKLWLRSRESYRA